MIGKEKRESRYCKKEKRKQRKRQWVIIRLLPHSCVSAAPQGIVGKVTLLTLQAVTCHEWTSDKEQTAFIDIHTHTHASFRDGERTRARDAIACNPLGSVRHICMCMCVWVCVHTHTYMYISNKCSLVEPLDFFWLTPNWTEMLYPKSITFC